MIKLMSIDLQVRSSRGIALGVVVGAFALIAGGCKGKQENQYVPPPPPEVTVAKPKQSKITVSLEYTAITRGKERVEIRARVKGFVMTKHVDGGKRVKAGDLIFTIDPRSFEAAVKEGEAEVATQRAALKLADVTLTRYREAFASQAANQQELDTATAQRDSAKAQLELAEAKLVQSKLDLEYTHVRSPINGRLSLETIDIGQLVGANDATLMAFVIDDSIIYARYAMPEKTVLQLQKQYANKRPGEDGRANLKVMMAMPNETEFEHEGWFDKADNTVSPQTGTVDVEAAYENPDSTILPGLFVRVRPVLGEQDAMLVPDIAIGADQSGKFVLTVDDKNIVHRTTVTVGQLYERMRRIESGLTGNERIVVNGLQRARPGSTVKPVDEDAPPPAPPGPPGTAARPASGG